MSPQQVPVKLDGCSARLGDVFTGSITRSSLGARESFSKRSSRHAGCQVKAQIIIAEAAGAPLEAVFFNAVGPSAAVGHRHRL